MLSAFPQKTVAVIGGGPAGLMAAEVMAEAGLTVDVFDAMPSVGRKFLLAGVGGMNITHSESLDAFAYRYGEREAEIRGLLAAFGPDDLRAWIHGLGIETFVGTSGRVFPTDMKAAPLLRAWLHRLRNKGVRFHTRHRFVGWDKAGYLRFQTQTEVVSHHADAVVLALGGGSWSRLGSDGAWVPWLQEKGVAVAPLRPSNCGFEVAGWSDHFRERFAGAPLKSVSIRFVDAQGREHQRTGECVVTATGLEGSLIYSLSAAIRQALDINKKVRLLLDLAPDRNVARLSADLATPRGKSSMAAHLRKRTGLEGVKAGLLRECAAEAFASPAELAAAIKSLPVTLVGTRPVDEAISTAGGVRLEAMNAQLMVTALPGLFCAGEMLDWEAPTGGYLLTACFASGRMAGNGVLTWLSEND